MATTCHVSEYGSTPVIPPLSNRTSYVYHRLMSFEPRYDCVLREFGIYLLYERFHLSYFSLLLTPLYELVNGLDAALKLSHVWLDL